VKKLKSSRLGFIVLALVTCMATAFISTGCSRWYADYGINKGQLRSREILPNLILALDDPKPRTRHSALRIISRLKHTAQEAIPKVTELAKNDVDEDIRHYAINVLRMIMPYTPENVDFMSEVIRANSGELAKVAEQTLNSIKTKGVPSTESENSGEIHLDDGVEIKLTPEFLFYNGYVTLQPSRSAHMLPVEIQISNQTNALLSLTAESFKLSDNEGKQRSQLPIEAAIKRQQYDIGAAVLRGLVILGPIPAIKAGRANGIISKFCEEKILTELELQPGENVKKVLFFDCPLRPKQITGWELDFSCLQKEYGKQIDIKYFFGTGAQITTREIAFKSSLSRPSPSPVNLESKLLELKYLKDKKIITEEEYFEKRRLLIKEF